MVIPKAEIDTETIPINSTDKHLYWMFYETRQLTTAPLCPDFIKINQHQGLKSNHSCFNQDENVRVDRQSTRKTML